MSQAKTNDTVKVHYTGKLDDGTVFDSSRDREPLTFRIGGGGVIPGFEQSVAGMTVGETKSVTIPPTAGFGKHSKDLILKAKKTDFPNDITPEVGKILQWPQGEGKVAHVQIIEVTDDTVTIDGNHPLAGKTVVFDIELLEIVEAG